MFNFDSGIKKPKNKTKIVVAMSGGVDSSVTAALLSEAGFDVIGMTLQLYDYGDVVSKKTCCAGIDVYDAKTVADKIGIPHYVLNYQNIFKESVIEDFADSYIRGEIPIPCIRCNETVKFRDMFKMAKDLGADILATGHYVQHTIGKYGAEMHQAIDSNKDQSYFLFSTTKQQLDFIRFPLGSITKIETRKHAKRLNLNIAEKPDSQDICFIPDGNYAKTVERIRPGALDPGKIIDNDGNIIGNHQGIINYTIGQRKGLGISSNNGEILYVIKINPDTKEVTVGPKKLLAKKTLRVKNINWLGYPEETQDKYDITVKIRSSQSPIKASLELQTTKEGIVTLISPEYGISAGQACVFYQESRVLGGGWITN